jgi:hypothetical protein
VLHPGDIIHGWVAFNYPTDFVTKPPRACVLRVTIKDGSGKAGVAIGQLRDSTLEGLQTWDLDLNGKVDLSFMAGKIPGH